MKFTDIIGREIKTIVKLEFLSDETNRLESLMHKKITL